MTIDNDNNWNAWKPTWKEVCEDNFENIKSTNTSTKLKKEEIISILWWESDEWIDELIKLFRKIWWRKGFLRLKSIIQNHSEEEIWKNIDHYINDIVSWNFKESIAKEYIQKLILERIKSERVLPITQWQEWEIFKLQLSNDWINKEYIVAKRKFMGASSWSDEFQYQRKASELLQSSIVNNKRCTYPRQFIIFQMKELIT